MPDALDSLTAALADRYRIEGELGQGGMATVYLAEDLKHHRKVAVKVLRPELAAVLGAERFLNEIELTANLQHPHILPLYDSGVAGKSGGSAHEFLYYVMPYVQGESLREKLDREKELSIEESLDIAKAAAAALDYAHREGVIHRDIKPENILLQDGQAVVSDFGIARAVSSAGGTRLTETGLSLGTPHYMSPEQAAGDRDLDKRTDVYSLGTVVYEMLAGEPPYTGHTAQAVLTKIITERPRPLREIRDTIPPNVEAAVSRALAKRPADRFATGARFADALLASGTEPVAGGLPRTGGWRRAAVASAAIVAALLVGVAVGRLSDRGGAPAVARFTVPASITQGPQGAFPIAISPDGSRVVYVSGDPPDQHLVMRPLDRLESTTVSGTEGASDPFFSADGEWLGFLARDTLWRVPPQGGVPFSIGEASRNALGPLWTPDDDVLLTLTPASGLTRRPAFGGEAQVVSTPDRARGEIAHIAGDVLPGGRDVLVTIYRGGELPAQVGITSLTSGETTVLIDNGASPRLVPPGHIAYVRSDGTLLAATFDAQSRAVGDPVPAADGVFIGGVTFRAAVVTSKSGDLAYVPGIDPNQGLMIVDRDGNTRSLDFELPDLLSPRFSPDGRRVVASAGGRRVWVYEVATGTSSPVTAGGGGFFYPRWAPDGQRITMSSNSSEFSLFSTPADGSGSIQPLVESERALLTSSWAPDGRSLVFRYVERETGRYDIGIARPGEGAEAQVLFPSPASEWSPAISPDGRWLAYVSDESGDDEVYVRPFPDALSGKWKVSEDGGNEPVWGPNGDELFFLSGNQLVSARVQTTGTFAVLGRNVLFQYPGTPMRLDANYDVHPDGERFLMVEPGDVPSEVVVVMNFAEELRGL